ncbi:MAG: hypothetical protein MZU91_11485 [Desulfosudis oleivorans]|nr:hypothetical protein [Desulfosudis oleivorans]
MGSIYGPKVMVINEYAGSGGDMMPWLLPGGRGRAARRQADLGRPGRHGRGGAADGRRLHGRAAERLLEPQRDVGRREPRRRPRLRGRDGPGLGHGRPRSRSSRRPFRWRSSLLAKNPPPKHKKPAYPDYQKKK